MAWSTLVRKLESTAAMVVAACIGIIACAVVDTWPNGLTVLLTVVALVAYATVVAFQLQAIEWAKVMWHKPVTSFVAMLLLRLELLLGWSLALGSAFVLVLLVSVTVRTFLSNPLLTNLTDIALASGTFFMYYLSKCYLHDRLDPYVQLLPKENGET